MTRPTFQRLDSGTQRLAVPGQRVLDADRTVLDDGAVHDTVGVPSAAALPAVIFGVVEMTTSAGLARWVSS